MTANARWSSGALVGDAGREADAAARRIRWRHQLPDGVEHDAELGVVFLLQLVEASCELGAGLHEPAQADEGAHDLDVHLDRPWAVQDAGEHGDALLGEGVGTVASAASTV